ncbi:MAG TPA: polyprenyl synthetase family protein [Terriglobia bacterium]|nr:polyprenyl synthetase family protein [Terriglobia bacterium]
MASTGNITVKEVFDLVREDLARVEKEFARQTVSSVQPITEIGQYLKDGGGKRLRPALVLLASKLCGYQGPAAVQLGVVVEMIHTATLVHDDIIDEADTRRGRPSTNSRWGNHRSVLAGDWLYMQAFSLALARRDFRILDLLIALTQVMVEGEMLQLTLLKRLDVTEDDYFDLIYRKTAALFSACLRLGALVSGNDDATETRLGSCGTHLGLAFQLIDDVLDFSSSEERLGKPVGNDLREGKITLPVIYLLQRCRPDEKQKVAQVLADGAFAAVSLAEIQDLVERYGTLDAARARAREYAQRAAEEIEEFPPSRYRDALRSLSDFIVERQS